MNFKTDNTFETRQRLSKEIKEKYPDRTPVVIEPSTSNTVKIEKSKFLVPSDLTVGRFMHEIRKHLSKSSGNRIPSQEALFIFIGNENRIPCVSDTMSFLYERHADKDGFLYISYAQENTFG